MASSFENCSAYEIDRNIHPNDFDGVRSKVQHSRDSSASIHRRSESRSRRFDRRDKKGPAIDQLCGEIGQRLRECSYPMIGNGKVVDSYARRKRSIRSTDFFLLAFIFCGSFSQNGNGAYAAPVVESAKGSNTLDVLRDQPGTSPLEIDERARRCSNVTQLCADDDLEATSVCGSDGRTYSSVCEAKKMACHGNPVYVIDTSGPCPAKKKCVLERTFQKELARRRNHTDVVIPECEADGSYSPVQCHKETGFCWCVTNVGRPIPTTSVQFKRPDCMPQGKVGRRSSRRRLGMRRRGCSTADRSTFSSNLMKAFRDEYEKETRQRPSQKEDTNADVVALKTKQVMKWKFDKLDTNRDQLISPRESAELRRMIRDRVQPKACARRFAKYCDLDANKRITRTEWSICLGVDINMSFQLFRSLNTSDELQKQERQRGENDRNGTDADEEEYDTENEQLDEITTTTEAVAWTETIGQRSARNKQRNDGGGRRRQGFDSGARRQSRLQAQQQTQRRHAGGLGALQREDALVEASRNIANSAAGLSFLSERTQKAEKDEIEPEPTDCQSMRRKAQEDHQRNPESGVYIPKCQNAPDSNGVVGRLFERVQCHDLAGFCWCADPESGKPIPGTPKKLEKPDCSPSPSATKPGSPASDGCTPKKRADFLRRLHGALIAGMIASGHADSEDMSRVERALRWKFDELDKNKNKVLERKEWKPYRLELKTWRGLRKCGRNFLRSCDANGDRRITLSEWLNCAATSLRAVAPTTKPNNRRGPNPFVVILDPHQ